MLNIHVDPLNILQNNIDSIEEFKFKEEKSNLSVESKVKQSVINKNVISRNMINIQNSLDQGLIRQFSNSIVSGYLNLSEEQGWKEGSNINIGASFTRFMLSNFYLTKINQSVNDILVIENVLKSFRDIGTNYDSLPKVKDGHRPISNRVCYDSSISGWKDHAVNRLVGNLASQYGKGKPFFEILVNSQRTTKDDPECTPFYVTIYQNEKALDQRQKKLELLCSVPGHEARLTFYNKDLKDPKNFLLENKEQLGPNSTRILKGLEFLSKKKFNAQKVGSCWIKQPMRCLLASLYLELLSSNNELSQKQAMAKAVELYKNIQYSSIPFIESTIMNLKPNISPKMYNSATNELEKQKELLRKE